MRRETLARLRCDGLAKYLSHDEPLFWHGRAYTGPSILPNQSWNCCQKPRDDHEAPDWLTASEFEDVPEVRTVKIAALARLLRISKRTCVYTGAGISRGAGIGQAARGAVGVPTEGDTGLRALPTFTHYALTALAEHGLLHSWTQQNHDGLVRRHTTQRTHHTIVH